MMNQVSIDRALLQPCPKLPLLDEGKTADRFYLAKTVIIMYGNCKRKHKALIDSVNAIENSGRKHGFKK